jgi:hypothetical protein
VFKLRGPRLLLKVSTYADHGLVVLLGVSIDQVDRTWHTLQIDILLFK